MNLAYRKKDYKGAKKYAALTGGKSLKVLCAKSCITFYFFVWLKGLRKVIKN